MEFSLQGFLSFGSKITLPPSRRSRRRSCSFMEVSAFSYQKFVNFGLEETERQTHLTPSPLQVQVVYGFPAVLEIRLLQEQFSSLKAMDGKTELKMLSFQAPKIRLLRSLSIEGQAVKVLDFAVFPEPEFDLPIFCANFVTAASMNIIVLDLNPLYDVINQRNYKEKYYKKLMPLGLKYAELLPWGGKITSESLRFFSPIVIWTKFTSSQNTHDILYSAFMDYYKAWLEMMNDAAEEKDAFQISCNCEAQHKYLTWRTEKDPGHQMLKKLIGESLAKDLVSSFLFNGVTTLGRKTFSDYFPEYKCEDGTINAKRSIIGKSFETRPWDTGGEFTGKDLW